jgi:hypothetical protein
VGVVGFEKQIKRRKEGQRLRQKRKEKSNYSIHLSG